MRVEVYWNLHKHVWSVRHKGRVIKHLDFVTLRDVTWVVQPAGNARVRREGKKNVHAFARGTLGDIDDVMGAKWDCLRLVYNPYKFDSFVDDVYSLPVGGSDMAILRTVNNRPWADALWVRVHGPRGSGEYSHVLPFGGPTWA